MSKNMASYFAAKLVEVFMYRSLGNTASRESWYFDGRITNGIQKLSKYSFCYVVDRIENQIFDMVIIKTLSANSFRATWNNSKDSD